MRRLLDQLRTRFDRVILDTPPVLPLADVAMLAPLVDGSLMVVRAGVTPKPAIENALRAFDSSRLLGVVLNESGIEQDYRYEAVSTSAMRTAGCGSGLSRLTRSAAAPQPRVPGNSRCRFSIATYRSAG